MWAKTSQSSRQAARKSHLPAPTGIETLEPPVRIELTTARLQGECSTTELRRPSNPTRLSGQFSASMTRCERTEVDDRLGRQPGIGMRSAILLSGLTT